MLTDALKTLSNPPSMREKRKALDDVNGQCAALRSQLGEPHKKFQWNAARAIAELAELKNRAAAKNLTPTPAAAASASDPRPIELTGDGTLDKAIAASGTSSLRAFKLKAKRDRLFAAVSNLPPNSTARARAEVNLAKAQTELNQNL